MLEVPILAQPDDTTCGPTSLHAVYAFLGDPVPLSQIITEVPSLEEGGTLAVYLGLHALSRGYDATLFSYNLKEFDPTWKDLPSTGLASKLEQQLQHKRGKRFTAASHAYIRFLQAGGSIRFDPLDASLLASFLGLGLPVLAGLSATYLYGCARERECSRHKNTTVLDDIRGEPAGHFVVIRGLTADGQAHIADPYHRNPISGVNDYPVPVARLLNAILLGVVTYDANLLVISPKS